MIKVTKDYIQLETVCLEKQDNNYQFSCLHNNNKAQ